MDPQPADRDAEPVAQPDQEIDVGDAPYPPRKGAAQFYPSEINHGFPLADLRQAAGVLVVERGKRTAAQARPDGIGDITSLLFGRGRNAGDRLAVRAVDRDGIADCKSEERRVGKECRSRWSP